MKLVKKLKSFILSERTAFELQETKNHVIPYQFCSTESKVVVIDDVTKPLFILKKKSSNYRLCQFRWI